MKPELKVCTSLTRGGFRLHSVLFCTTHLQWPPLNDAEHVKSVIKANSCQSPSSDCAYSYHHTQRLHQGTSSLRREQDSLHLTLWYTTWLPVKAARNLPSQVGSATFRSGMRTKCFWDCSGLIKMIYFFSLLVLQALTSKHQFRP